VASRIYSEALQEGVSSYARETVSDSSDLVATRRSSNSLPRLDEPGDSDVPEAVLLTGLAERV
jgi:hypothetical protein